MRLRMYAIVTGLLGVTQVVFNGFWIHRLEIPFLVPQWLVYFELAWAFVSFAVLLTARHSGRATLLAGSYVIYTGFAVVYTVHMGVTHGAVTDGMIPDWWKILAVTVGLGWIAGSASLISAPPRPQRQS
ncbi:MAG: hypothetical protein ABI718_07565 [Acidobacteriota bacterium]